MKRFLIFSALFAFTIPLAAQSFSYRSAENALKKASDLETWQQQLRYHEQQLAEREQTVFGKLEDLQQQHQQGMQQAAEREEALRRNLQQQQQQARDQAFRTELHQQQQAAQQRETALQRQVEEQRERAAYERLQQGMQLFTLQQQLQEQREQESGPNTQQTKAYGYADKQINPDTQGQSPDLRESSSPPLVGGGRGEIPPGPPLEKGGEFLLIFDAPTPVATVAALESKVHTTINGIDRIETRAILPENLSVEQLEAVKQITDNGALIAQQRLGLEQYQIGSNTKLSRLQVLKGFVLWGLLLSIPSLLTLSWIVRNIVRALQSGQQEKLAYKLKELESVERQIAITERQFDADHQR